jgi:hypothetical protein
VCLCIERGQEAVPRLGGVSIGAYRLLN